MPDIRRPSLSLLLLAAAAFSPQPAFGQTSLLDVLRANKDPLTSSSTLPFNLTVLVDTILPQFPAITAILQDPSPKVFIAPSNSAIRSFTSQDASNVLTEAILRYHIIPATATVDTSINAQTAKRAFFTTSNGAVIGLAAPAGGSAAGTLYTVTSGLPSQSNIGGSFPSSAVGTILLSDTVFLPPQPIAKVISKSSSIGLWAAAIPPDLIPAITAAPKNAVVFAITNDGITRAATALEQLPAYIREAVWYQTVAVNFSPDPFVSTLLQPGTVVQFTPIKYNSLVAVNASTTQTWTVKGQNATYPSATVTKQDAILTSDGGVIHFIDNIIMPRWDLIPSPSPTTTRPGGSLPTLPGISTPKPSPSSAASKLSISFIGDTFPVSLLVCLLTALVLALFP